MEGIPFIIVEHVPKGESGAERNTSITGLLGSSFPAAPVAPGRLRGCRAALLPLQPSSPRGWLSYETTASPWTGGSWDLDRKDHGPLQACWRDVCAMNRLPRPALLPEVLPDLSVRCCGWQSGISAGSQRAPPSPPLFSSQPEVPNTWRTCAYSPGLPLRSQLGSPWKEGFFIGTLQA